MAKIIVVDDSQAIRSLIQFSLSEQGHEVITAESAEQALELLENSDVDLILTDINMNGKSGYELAQILRTKKGFEHTPIIALTTESHDDSKRSGKTSGMTGWLIKPFQPERLTQIVKHFTT